MTHLLVGCLHRYRIHLYKLIGARKRMHIRVHIVFDRVLHTKLGTAENASRSQPEHTAGCVEIIVKVAAHHRVLRIGFAPRKAVNHLDATGIGHQSSAMHTALVQTETILQRFVVHRIGSAAFAQLTRCRQSGGRCFDAAAQNTGHGQVVGQRRWIAHERHVFVDAKMLALKVLVNFLDVEQAVGQDEKLAGVQLEVGRAVGGPCSFLDAEEFRCLAERCEGAFLADHQDGRYPSVGAADYTIFGFI